MKAQTLTPTAKHTVTAGTYAATRVQILTVALTTKQLNTQVTACHTLSNVNPHATLTFKHMPGHGDVRTNTVQKALYLCGSKRGKEEQDGTARKTKEERVRATCRTVPHDVRLSKL